MYYIEHLQQHAIIPLVSYIIIKNSRHDGWAPCLIQCLSFLQLVLLFSPKVSRPNRSTQVRQVVANIGKLVMNQTDYSTVDCSGLHAALS
jgi:hypothetical protein